MKGAIDRASDRIRTEREELWRVYEVVRLGARRIWQSGLPRMAAALSYRTIFSLVPVLVVAVVVIGSFATEDQLREQVQRLISFAGLDTIAVDPSDPDVASGADIEGVDDELDGAADVSLGSDGEPSVAADALVGRASGDGAQQRLDEWITDLVTRVSGLPFGALGVVGVAFLGYAALSMLIELERAFNQIYGAARSRNILQMVTTYWTALTLGVVFLLGTFYAGDLVAEFATRIGQQTSEGANGEAVTTSGWVPRQALEVVINLVINVGLLLAMYTVVPNTRVRFRPAFAGAVLAGVAWEAGKWGFTFYVKNFTGGLEQLYGAIALIPLFLLWVYVTWIIVLFGLQVSHSVQTFSVWAARDADEESPRVADPGLALVVAVTVARRFEKGRSSPTDEVAKEVGVEEALVRLLLARLLEVGIVNRLEDGGDVPVYGLAQPADSIRAAAVLEAAEGLTGAGDEPTGLLGQLGRARREVLAQRTLTDVMSGGVRGPAAGSQGEESPVSAANIAVGGEASRRTLPGRTVLALVAYRCGPTS